jgi:hypothetical protein
VFEQLAKINVFTLGFEQRHALQVFDKLPILVVEACTPDIFIGLGMVDRSRRFWRCGGKQSTSQ